MSRLGALVLAILAIGGVALAQQRPAQQRPVRQAGAPEAQAQPQALTPADEAADSTAILQREIFNYERAGRRDPFASLLDSDELRPGLHELTLTGVLVHPTRPVAVMRDKGGTQYRVTTGMTVGRARVIQIRPKTVIFAIMQYGYERRDSLVLGDSVQRGRK